MRAPLKIGLGSGLALALGLSPFHSARADELDKLGGTVLELDTRIRDLDAALKPPAEPGPEIAERRLIDAQVLYELKNYEAASIILFDLVEKYPKSSAYPEALFYLADSLYLKRDYLSSRRYFEKIVTIGPSNRRYQESLQRLIELSLHTGDYSPVDGYIAKLEGLAVDKQLPSVPYVKGKYFFFRQQYDKALAALGPIGPDHEYYFHAQYFIGATQVAQAQNPSLTPPQKAAALTAAAQTFTKLLAVPFKPTAFNQAQQRILELAHLALGRIYLDQGQLAQSLAEYGKITQKSDVFNDALYESAWVDIKGKDYTQARHQLDLLLLNAPDSPLAPEVKLLVGRLFIEQDNYNPATDAFTKTRDEYAPIQASLEQDLLRNDNPATAFADVIRRNLSKFDTKAVLSPAGAKWVRTENDVEHVSTLVNDEDELKRSLDEADDTIARLEKALGGPARVNVFPELAFSRGKAIEIANQATKVKKELTEKEAALIAPVAGNDRDALAKLDAERGALDKQLSLLPDNAADITERQQKIRNAFNGLDPARRRVDDAGDRPWTATRCTPRDRSFAIGSTKSSPSSGRGTPTWCRPAGRRRPTPSAWRPSTDAWTDAKTAFAEGDARLGKIKDALVTQEPSPDGKKPPPQERRRRRSAPTSMAPRADLAGPARQSRAHPQRHSGRGRRRRRRRSRDAGAGAAARPVRRRPQAAARSQPRRARASVGRGPSARRADRVHLGAHSRRRGQADHVRPAPQRDFGRAAQRHRVGARRGEGARRRLPSAPGRLHGRVGRRRRQRPRRQLPAGGRALLQHRRPRRRRHHRRGVGAQRQLHPREQSPRLGAQARAQAPRRRIQRSLEGAAVIAARGSIFAVMSVVVAERRFGGYAGHAGPDRRRRIKRLNEMQAELGRFEAAQSDYRGTVNHIVQRDYNEKRRALMSKYESQINAEDKSQKERRLNAIALFEKFLAKYTKDARWTPDAMFRLAELYFEKDDDAYLAATEQAGGSAQDVTPDFSKTIGLYKELITRFPKYRLIDGAYYLMGWCLFSMNKEPEGLQAMRGLVCDNKYQPLDPPPTPVPSRGHAEKTENPYADCEPVKANSRFLPEAWTRIGEYHFDNSELELAIAAYSRVLQFKDSPYYDKALYKLAWAYYRFDNYPEAVKRFDELVVFSDKKKAESGEEGSDLRAEAVQYLGISFAEKDWNSDGQEDAETGLQRAMSFYKGRENEPHVREIFAKLGDIYFDETEYFSAIAVYKKTLELWPFNPGNPKLQDRVVMAFERQRDFGNALSAREALARDYTRGTEWYKHNRDNKEALDSAAELAELALVSAAVNHHKAAQDLKKLAAAQKNPSGQMLEQISKEYALAAAAYQKYLEQYPSSKNTYEYSYAYAETLYYSGRFLDAAAQYEKVRDSNLDNKYAEDASFNAIKSYEKYLELESKAGKYTEPALPAVGTTSAPVQPLPIPDVVNKLQKAYDVFAQRVPNSGRIPTMTYKAAEVYYRYLHWDEARPRFEQILTKYCKDDMGANAGNAILVSYTIEKNLDKIEEWANKLKTANCGSTAVAAKNAGELTKLSLGVKFQKADKLFADSKFEEAAALYVQIVDADPHSEDADKALNNAAVAYEKVQRFAAATKLYERIVTDYPTSKFLDDALFRTAVSYQKAFDFDKAVVSYLRLAEDKRFAASTHHTDAIYNSAVLEENNQSYAHAAELYLRYSADPSVKRDDASEAYFHAALIYEKMKQPDKERKTLQQYIKTYGGDPKGSQRVLAADWHIAQTFEAERDHASAEAMYKKIVAAGSTAAPASEQAEFPAHASFILTEQKLPLVEKASIKGGGKALGASIQNFKKNVQALVDDYNKVIAFKRANWTLAAYFRTGYLFELFSKALLAAPCPPEVKKLGPDACDIYREQIEQTVAGVDEEAVKRYGVTLQQAGNLGVSNEWTHLARVRANAYKPELFPMVKDEHIEMQMENP